jgi:hypothetical protein
MVFDDITIIIRMQNIQLLKYIAWKEEWNYLELCKRYIK